MIRFASSLCEELGGGGVGGWGMQEEDDRAVAQFRGEVYL